MGGLGISTVLTVIVLAPPAHPQSGTTVGSFLNSQAGFTPANPPTQVEIAPMVSPGSPTPGAWTTVPNDFFNGISARSGITPGVSDPMQMQGRPGFIEAIGNSQVVNAGGSRATFGYFVKLKGEVPGLGIKVVEDFFVLMSYDNTVVDGKTFNAYEVFIFGPLPAAGNFVLGRDASPDPRSPLPLIAGLAVDTNGVLIDKVPSEIALVSNYRGAKVDRAKQVTPGVSTAGFGCFECHADRAGGFPNTTSPFPWAMTVGEWSAVQDQVKPPSFTPIGPPPQNGREGTGGVLQGVLKGIGVAPPPAGKPNKRGDDAQEERDGADAENNGPQ